MTESPIQVETVAAPVLDAPPLIATTLLRTDRNGAGFTTIGNVTRTSSSSSVSLSSSSSPLPTKATSTSKPQRVNITRNNTSLPMSARRPALRLTLSSEEQADFSAAIQRAQQNMVSDAAKLPSSTNMGLGNRPPAAATIAPASRAQPVSQSERAMIPTERERERDQRRIDARTQGWNLDDWEEDDAEARRPAHRAPASNAVFLQAIPCLFVTNVKSATTFYKDILGFEVLGKPDTSHAALYRSPPPSPSSPPPIKRGPHAGKLEAPPGSVQMYLRIAPMGPDGVRVKPPAVTLWMLVNDVDEVFKEITTKWSKFQPKENEYFPTHLFGDAKILAKPQNKAWGTRELHVIDGDENKILFFKQIY